MGATDLADARTPRPTPARARSTSVPRCALLVFTTLTALTTAAALAEATVGGLYSSAAPHPTLTVTAGAVLSILAANLRVTAAPFAAIALGWHHSHPRRAVGDLLIGAVLAENAVIIGLAIGRWGTRLTPYLPHLPIELTAVALAGGVWASARATHHAQPRRTVIYAAATVVLLSAAALIEVLCTPHR